MRDLGFDADRHLSLTDPGVGRAPAARRRTMPRGAPIAVANPLSQRALGAAHDAARLAARRRPLQPRPRRRARRAVRVRPRLPARGRASRAGGVLGGRVRRRAPGARATSRTGSRPSPSARCAAGWRGGGRRPTSSRSRACSRRSPPARRVELAVEAGAEPFLHPGRAGRGSWSATRTRAGSASCTRWSAASGTSTRRRGFEVDLAPLVAASRYGREHYEDVITYPAVHQDLAVVVDEERPPPRVARGRRWPAAASCCVGRGLRPLPRRAGRRGAQEPRAAARVPRPRPHPHRRGGRRAARGDQRERCERSEGALRE